MSEKISGVRHALGKAKLAWQRWEADGHNRALRYGIGLNDENKGATVIVLEVRKVTDKEWAYEVWPKNDYGDLLPSKYKGQISGFAKSKDAAKREAEKLVGLKRVAPKPKPKPKPVAVHWSKTAAGRAKHAERVKQKKARERAKQREVLGRARARAKKHGHKYVASYAKVAPSGAIAWTSYIPFNSSSIAKTWARSHAQKAAKTAARAEWIVLNNKTGATVAKGTEYYVKPADY